MARFAWNESYSVKVRLLDAQHKTLFETMNSLADAMRVGQGENVIREVVEQLAIYARTHFLQEKVLMKETGYPGLEAHRAQHRQLIADVEKYKKELENGQEPSTTTVLAFLQGWLMEHIRKSDQAYSEHLNAHAVW